MEKNKGFTLIELLVVIFIIGVLAAIVVVGVNSSRVKGRDARRKADLNTIKTAVELYANDNKTYVITDSSGNPTGQKGNPSNGWFNIVGTPTGGYNIVSIGGGLASRGYFGAAPADPMGGTYNNPSYGYMYYTDGNKYTIYARLEKPNCTTPCWDTTGIPAGTPEVNQSLNDGLKSTAAGGLWRNYRIGNGY